MQKHLIVLIIALVISNQSYAQTQSGTQNWECALDLHQGDIGTLSLIRDNNNLQGVISYRRNDSAFENDVSGSWNGDTITLKRIVGSDSSEDMSGVAIVLGSQKVNIGGRYATNYQGVWSADCDLVSEIATNDVSDETNAQTLPSTTSRVRPSTPNNSDSITFSALGSHPDGIQTMSFYLGDKKIHTCESDRCEFNYGRLATGSYSWRVEATSTTGITSTLDSNRLVVRSDAEVGNCTITGRATGQSAPLAEIYLVKLYGPNNTNLLKSSVNFTNGRYLFSNLPSGNYQLNIDTQGDQEILASPAKKTLTCTSQATLTQDIEFR